MSFISDCAHQEVRRAVHPYTNTLTNTIECKGQELELTTHLHIDSPINVKYSKQQQGQHGLYRIGNVNLLNQEIIKGILSVDLFTFSKNLRLCYCSMII